MAGLKLDKIIEEINNIFKRNYQYVFWYDQDCEFSDEIRNDNKEVTERLASRLIVIGKNQQFETKLKLLSQENINNKYLIYIKAQQPELQFNYFADMERYGILFKAEASEVIFQQLDEHLKWGPEKRNFVRKYFKYFRAKSRRQTFISNFEKRLINHPEYMILSNIAGLNQFDENDLLMKVLDSGIEENTNAIVQSFSKFNVLPIFWQIYDEYLGSYQKRKLINLFSGALITSIYSQLNESVPSSLKNYEFENYSNAQVFIQRFSDSNKYAALYDNLSEQVWKKYNLSYYLKNESFQQLEKIRGVKQVDELLLKRICDNFKNNGSVVDGESIAQAIDYLIATTNTFKFEATFLQGAYNILMYKPRYYSNWEKMLDDYGKTTYQIDSCYRKMINNYNSIKEINRAQYQRIKRLADNCYSNSVLDQSISEWNTNFKLAEVTFENRQESFYKEKVSNINERVVVIISDAFRYEAAKELESRLADDDRISTSMSYLLTGIPSVTYMGMPSLLPHKQLTYVKGKILVDGEEANNAIKRRKILKKYNENNDLFQLIDILNASSKEIKTMIAKKNVIYLYHNHVDAIGDNLKTEYDTFKATDEAINEIERGVQLLRTNGISHIVVTADHGFIYSEAPVKEQSKIDIPTKEYDGKISPRYLLTKTPIHETPGVLHTTLGESLGNDDTTNVYYPSTINVFKASGGKNYVHGGSSLQEMVIPVLDMKMTSAKSHAKFTKIKLAATQLRINALQMTLAFNQVEPISDLVKPQKFHIYFRDSSGTIISNLATVNANQTKDMINAPLVVKLAIQNRHYSYHENYYLVVQPLEDNTEPETYNYVMDLIN